MEHSTVSSSIFDGLPDSVKEMFEYVIYDADIYETSGTDLKRHIGVAVDTFVILKSFSVAVVFDFNGKIFVPALFKAEKLHKVVDIPVEV